MQPKLFLYCLNIAIRLTASTRPPRKRDDVSPKMWAMTIQVRENQVHGLPPVGCRTALGALSAERNGELFESGLDIVEFLDRRGCVTRKRRISTSPCGAVEHSCQLVRGTLGEVGQRRMSVEADAVLPGFLPSKVFVLCRGEDRIRPFLPRKVPFSVRLRFWRTSTSCKPDQALGSI